MDENYLETNGNQLWCKQKQLEEKQYSIGRKEGANWKTVDMRLLKQMLTAMVINQSEERWQTNLEISRKPAGTKQMLLEERKNQIERNGDTRLKPAETLGTMGDSDGWRVENYSEERGEPTEVDGTTRKDQVRFAATSKSIERATQIMRKKAAVLHGRKRAPIEMTVLLT